MKEPSEFRSYEEAVRFEYKQRVSGIAQNLLCAMLSTSGMKSGMKHMARAVRDDGEIEIGEDSIKTLRPMVERSVIMAKYLCELTDDVVPPPGLLAYAREHDAEFARQQATPETSPPNRVEDVVRDWLYQCWICGEATNAKPRVVGAYYFPSCCSRLSCSQKYDGVPVEKVDPALIAAAASPNLPPQV